MEIIEINHTIVCGHCKQFTVRGQVPPKINVSVQYTLSVYKHRQWVKDIEYIGAGELCKFDNPVHRRTHIYKESVAQLLILWSQLYTTNPEPVNFSGVLLELLRNNLSGNTVEIFVSAIVGKVSLFGADDLYGVVKEIAATLADSAGA